MNEKEALVRFGISMPQSLIEQFDAMLVSQGYDNRSEAVRDLVRRALLAPGHIQTEQMAAGTIVLVYDHHVSDLPMVLTDLQHQYHQEINSNLHIHLNHNQCLEVIVVRGIVSRLRDLQQRIQVLKGVSYAELSVTHVDESDTAVHGHHHHDHDHDGHHHN
ncbi:CopG family transcriptional regulator, nickel-responsive regulator [Paenibacillus sp. 1_12]|uniref:nickel-responsive transcriptional regulator NikR n=1 Tax=Paenibacillus sp. 1_12 TaxID=1566278 RepID=UPI0008E263E8|nr:nickel-responsive transcriptional regulator NikR [Paenibacillus sp. 1_12]SFL12646.1 CopG family transcriptional regulator, nickel-responsive regulator [Paenibacillus sp. 1_12]